jgi:hypothetical protein
MTKLFVLPNDAYPFKSTKNTVRHTNFDADLSGNNSSVARTFSDFKGLGEIEIDASTIVEALDGSNQFLISNLVGLESRTVTTSTWMTLRSEAGGGDCAAAMAAGAVLLPETIYASDHGSFPNGVLFRTTGVGNLTAGFTGKFYVDMADGIPDSPSVKKETKKETRATYTVLD